MGPTRRKESSFSCRATKFAHDLVTHASEIPSGYGIVVPTGVSTVSSIRVVGVHGDAFP